MTTENTEQRINSQQNEMILSLKQSLGILPGAQRIKGMDSLRVVNSILRMNITLCPLYTQGELDQSYLLESPNAVQESRVAAKWQAGIASIQTVRDCLEAYGVNLHVVFSFADLGVITPQPEDEVNRLLIQQRQQYQEAAQASLEDMGVTWAFQAHSELGVEFPRVFSLQADGLTSGDRRIDFADRLFAEISQRVALDASALAQEDARPNKEVQPGGTRFGKKARKIVGSMVNLFGPSLTRLFLLYYGTFDGITNRPGDLNCYFERGDLLLNITNLFPHGNDTGRSRVDIKV